MIYNAIAFMLGTAFAFFSSELVDQYWISLLPVFLLLSVFQRNYRFISLSIAAYLWACLFFYQSLDLRLIPSFENSVVNVTGIIADIPEIHSKSIRLLIKPEYINGYSQALPHYIRLNWYQTAQIPKAGERWQLKAKLKRPSGFQNPGGFDYERWLFVKKIGASGYVKQTPDNGMLDSAPWWHINAWRHNLLQGLNQQCSDCEALGLVKALALGFRGDIESDHRRILQDTGTAHLLAISGLHIGLIATLFFGLGRLLWRFHFYRYALNRLEFASLLAVLAALLYAALAGFSIPTIRALIMLVVVFAALCSRVGINLANSIAIAILVILVADPLAIGSSSFWLSISALLIIAFAQYRLSQIKSKWHSTLIIQMMFFLMLVPISILVFDQINPSSFLANIVAIPLISLLILPLSLISSLSVALDFSVSSELLFITSKLLSGLLDYLNWLTESKLAALQNVRMPGMLLILMILALFVLLMPKGFSGKKPALLLLLIPFFWDRSTVSQNEFKLTVLDVGMGTSVVIQTRHHSLIYDFGPGKSEGFSAGRWVVAPFLQYEGIVTPDLMIISHVDQDHSGGFYSFKHKYQPERLVSGTEQAVRRKFKLNHAVMSCHKFQPWIWDGVEFEFLNVSEPVLTDGSNNRSCVLKVSGTHTALLSGDIESEQEKKLIESLPEALAADFLVAPHHGSLTSSTTEFVRGVSPSIVVFTVGKGNRWGFPKAGVVSRYEQINSQILQSDEQGAISFTSGPNGFQLNSFRESEPKIWH